MSRYGWSNRPELSPLPSNLSNQEGGPAVTDDDFSYITSEDLERHGLDIPGAHDHEPRDGIHYARSAPGPDSGFDKDDKPEDDVLLIKNKGITYPEHFPAYSIGDGKLLVCDLRDRIRLLLQLSERRARRIRLLYKGHQLKDSVAPVREYGVKNKSEILVVLGDSGPESSEDSSEEAVVLEQTAEDARKKSKKKRRGKKREDRTPRDSGSNVGLDVNVEDLGRRGGSTSRPQSPASGVSGASAAAAVPGGPIDKLNSISSHFTTKLLPLCIQFTASPPSDRKRREEEHRKLSEMVMQQVLLKLDAVDTAGEEAARNRRKELVRQVQNVLKGLDEKVHS